MIAQHKFMLSFLFRSFRFHFSYQMFATTLSALYGKLLVVMGIAFPMAEVISTYIPPSFYEVNIDKSTSSFNHPSAKMMYHTLQFHQSSRHDVVSPSFFFSILQVFYLYLYVGSMLFLFFMYTTLIWGRPKAIKVKSKLMACSCFLTTCDIFIRRVHVFRFYLFTLFSSFARN